MPLPNSPAPRLPGRALPRWRALLAGLWAGGLLVIATLVMPSAFAVLTRLEAGLLASRLFTLEAQVSLALGLLLMLLARREAGGFGRTEEPPPGQAAPPVMTAEVLLPLFALFCTVLGHYGVQPMMTAARAGEAVPLGFGLLHGLSTACYGLKLLAVLALAWRATSRA